MKRNTSPIALVERAVLVACANSRRTGYRQDRMQVFANRLGNYLINDPSVDLERECIRIVRSAGHRYAKKLLNWMLAVKEDEPEGPNILFPRGIPKQSRGNQSELNNPGQQVLSFSGQGPVQRHRRIRVSQRPGNSQQQSPRPQMVQVTQGCTA